MLYLVCAIPCEAEPLIRFFGLKSLSNELPFRIFSRGEISLVITGVGRIAAATACGYLHGQFAKTNPIWLNVGIAGHPTAEIGNPFMVHKIEGARSFYPSFTFSPPCPTAPLLTVDKPAKELSKECLYDMEGAGFYESAARFSSLELIHLVKIVSDDGAQILDKNRVSALVEKQILLIEEITLTLQTLQEEIHLPTTPAPKRLSATEQHQWKRLITQAEALGLSPKEDLPSLRKQIEDHVPAHLH
ncbi:MAG: Futalosine hydrolase [Chlamydiae bacterium]|nr:Futalosine hydrolase [Chlamydiota bacterium]